MWYNIKDWVKSILYLNLLNFMMKYEREVYVCQKQF